MTSGRSQMLAIRNFGGWYTDSRRGTMELGVEDNDEQSQQACMYLSVTRVIASLYALAEE